MRPQTFIVALAFALGAPVSLAQQTETPLTDIKAPEFRMTQRLEEMQSLMDKMSQTNSQAERRQLAADHREKVRDAMGMMRGKAGKMGKDRGRGMMAAPHGGGQSMAPMMDRMEKMQAHLDMMMNAKDPTERQKLMMEHRDKMRDSMAMMREMHAGAGRGMGKMDHKGSGGHHMMMTSMMAAYKQMDKRLDVMQMMMEQILQQQIQ